MLRLGGFTRTVCLMALRRRSSLLALCAVTATYNGTLPQRRQLRKTAGEHMDDVKAWVRRKQTTTRRASSPSCRRCERTQVTAIST